MIGYLFAQFVAGGKAVASGFGMDQDWGILLAVVVLLVYTIVGRFMTVSLTDVMQPILMIFALRALPIIAIYDAGGLLQLLIQLSDLDITYVDPFAISAGVAIGFLGIGPGSPGNPHILARLFCLGRIGCIQ